MAEVSYFKIKGDLVYENFNVTYLRWTGEYFIVCLRGPGKKPGPGAGAPDLVVTSLEVTGPATVNAENFRQIPIRVVVRNRVLELRRFLKSLQIY